MGADPKIALKTLDTSGHTEIMLSVGEYLEGVIEIQELDHE
jgi:hypothetical protein